MMFLDIALFFLAFIFAIPAVTGYFAYSHGRSFWLWFALGCFLPVISNLLLALLCRNHHQQVHEAKSRELTRYEEEYMREQIKIILYTSEQKK